MNENERRFTGWWIPVELREEHGASAVECMLWAEIHALSQREAGCTAGNEHFAESLDLSEGRVSHMIASLKSKGLVRQESFDGRVRVLRAELPGNRSKAALLKTARQVAGNSDAGLLKTATLEGPAYKGESKGENESKKNSIPPGKPLRGCGAPSAEAKAIVQAFAAVFTSRFRRSYLPDPKRDVEAAKALLAAGVGPEGVRQTFLAATMSKGWWCQRVTTLPALAQRWNEVTAELHGSEPSKDSGGQTADQWVEELSAPPA